MSMTAYDTRVFAARARRHPKRRAALALPRARARARARVEEQ